MKYNLYNRPGFVYLEDYQTFRRIHCVASKKHIKHGDWYDVLYTRWLSNRDRYQVLFGILVSNRYSFTKQILVYQTNTCLLWCVCLGLVQKGADQASDPGSWLKIFDQNLCLASNIYIVYYSGVFFFGKTIQRQQKDR